MVGRSIFLVGVVFAGFVRWVSFFNGPSKSPKAGGHHLLSLVVDGIVYVVGVAGPALGVKMLLERMRDPHLAPVEVYARSGRSL